MKRILPLVLALILWLPAPFAGAWGPQNYIDEDALPPETLYALEGQTFVQAIDEAPYLYLLTEDAAGGRTLTIFAETDGEYLPAAASAPLPEMNGIKPSIIANCILYSESLIYGFDPDSGGVWRLTFVQGQTAYRCRRYWLIEQDVWEGRMLYAADINVELSRFDPRDYPPDFGALAKTLDTDGYALVNNPDPNDRLHLRAEPGKTSESKGKYYNGAPVRIEEDLGDWARVSVAGVEGYMMKKYLAVGADMLGVVPAFAELFVKSELYGQALNVYTLPDSQSGIAGIYPIPDYGTGDADVIVIGVVGDDWVHVICGDGLAGYMPASQFFPGNG